jgi:hypothetical protein
MILGALVLKGKDDVSSHLGVGPVANNARIFGRDMNTILYCKRSIKAQSSSKHLSQRMATELSQILLIFPRTILWSL